MTQPSRQTVAGRAYLDLQNRARQEGRGTQELLTLYIVERWLARLSQSPYADQFVLEGGMLLAAFDARRATADADALARNISNDEAAVLARVVEVAGQPVPDDGVVFRTDTTTARTIRDDAFYPGVRVAMDTRIASAAVKFRLDVNFGDPVTPAPQLLELPPLRPDTEPIRVLGYPIVTVLAEKIATAVTLGAANTRVRDYADVFTLTGRYDVTHAVMREALLATAAFRGTTLQPLSEVIHGLVGLRAATYTAYRTSLGPDGTQLPAHFDDVVIAVTAFADPLAEPGQPHMAWQAAHRRWQI